MLTRIACLTAVALCTSVASAANVSLGGAVSVSGTGFGTNPGWPDGYGDGWLAPLQSVTDGVFLPENTTWNHGTVYWTGPFGAEAVTIALNQTSTVSGITLQADTNDDYRIEYLDTAASWRDLVTIDRPLGGWGMVTGSVTFDPVTTTAFRISAVGGDTFYSVSEFQAFGSVVAVPEPASYLLLLTGLGVLGLVSRRSASAVGA